MAKNQLNSKVRYELAKWLKEIERSREGMPRPKLSDKMLEEMASEQFGRHLTNCHIRNTRITFGYFIKPTEPHKEIARIPQEVLPPNIRVERRINKKVFQCDCGQKFIIRIRKC